MSIPQHSERTIDSADGATLYTQSWRPPTGRSSKAHLVMCHGYLEHCGRYKEVAEYLATQHGIATTVFDFRGHGLSAGTRAYCAKFTNYHDDIEAVVQDVVAANKDPDSKSTTSIPMFLLGHSFGALAVLDYLLADIKEDSSIFKTSVKGIIVTSPFLAPANELSYFKVIISKVLGNVWPKLALPVQELTAEVLTHDEVKRQEHKRDPLVQSKFTVGWAVQGMRAQDRVMHELKECPLPLLFIYAEEDKVACAATNTKFANANQAKDKTVVLRTGEYHEILNETNRMETYNLIKDWVLQRI